RTVNGLGPRGNDPEDLVGFLSALGDIFLAGDRLEDHALRVYGQRIVRRGVKPGEACADRFGQSNRVSGRLERELRSIGGDEDIAVGHRGGLLRRLIVDLTPGPGCRLAPDQLVGRRRPLDSAARFLRLAYQPW